MARIKQCLSVILLLFVVVASTPIMGRYFLEIEFYNRQVNTAADWVLLFCIPLSILFLGSCFRCRSVKLLSKLVAAGCFIILPLVFIVVGFANQFRQAYDRRLLSEVPVGTAVYRLYEETPNYVPLAIPYFYVSKEFDTPFGFKLISYKWGATTSCGLINIRPSENNIIEVVSKMKTEVILARFRM